MASTWLDVLEEHARLTPQHIALTLRSHQITYAGFLELVQDTAVLLQEMGIEAGDRVALLAPARPEAMITFLACCKIGAIWVSLNPKYKEGEIEYVVNHARPTLTLSVREFDGNDYTAPLQRVNERLGDQATTLVFFDGSDATPSSMLQAIKDAVKRKGTAPADGSASRSASSESRLLEQRGPDSPCMLVYTSGTTGKPKGVLLSQTASLFRAQVQARYFKTATPPTIVNFSAINHVGGMQFRSAAILAAGGTIHFQERFKPAETLALIREARINMLMLGPTMLHMLMREPSFDVDVFKQLDWYISAGAALPIGALKLIGEHCPNVATVYGATETCATVSYASLSDSFDAVAYSIGWPIPGGEMRVADDQETPLAAGEEGELQVRKQYCMNGYLNDPDATREAFTGDGWFKTGDRAVMLADGSFKIIGRIKEMFKSGGYNVYPREVEIMLESHPALKMSAVVPVDDPLFQQVGHAFVLLHEGCAETEADLIAWCKERLANYKVPKRIFIESELPMLPIGKVDKVRLREIAAAAAKEPLAT